MIAKIKAWVETVALIVAWLVLTVGGLLVVVAIPVLVIAGPIILIILTLHWVGVI